MKNLFYIIAIMFLLCFCREKNKSRESVINQLAYPITIEEVIKKIGKPDSITFENYDAGSFGVSINKIYHYGGNQLIFSPHGIYHGKKEIKSKTGNK